MVDLVDELRKAFHGDAWHGNNTLSLIRAVDPDKAFRHHIADAHSIAELVLHLTSWTEEVTDRLNGGEAKEPTRGDWPTPSAQSATEWEFIIADFEKANIKLIEQISGFASSDWGINITDKRNRELGTGVNNAQLLNGLLQHHAYHSGQIALLSKF